MLSGNIRLSFYPFLFSLVSSQITSYTNPDPLAEAGTQYILYNSTITANFIHPGSNLSHCGDNGAYDMSIGTGQPLYIGVNPPWDTNPMFFWFYRANFRTAAYVCYKGNEPCGSIERWPWYYVHAQLVDVRATSVSRLRGDPSGGDGGGDETYYSITGNENSFVSNHTTLDPALFFTAPGTSRNVTKSPRRDSRGCVAWESISWNATTPFTYTLNFTNTTASASVAVSAPEGQLTLRYSGTREYDPAKQPDNGNTGRIAISLATPEDHVTPHFTFANGMEFEFRQEGDDTWYARPKTSVARANSCWLIMLWLPVTAVSLWIL